MRKKAVIAVVATAIALLMVLPTFAYEGWAGGVRQYETFFINNPAGRESTVWVAKFYDHDEGVVCYVSDGFKAGGISCVKD